MMKIPGATRWLGLAFLVLAANSLYLLAFAEPSLAYMTNVMGHIVLGALVALLFVWSSRRAEFRAALGWSAVPLAIGALTGAALMVTGAGRDFQWLFTGHIVMGLGGAVALVWVLRERRVMTGLVVAGLVCAGAAVYQQQQEKKAAKISNPHNVPVTMGEEGGGKASPFWPSSARTNVGGVIPSKFFMDSKSCEKCHKDIYEQWNSSMHHFSSFNNKYYSKSIEHMQELSGTQGSKWCAGCHDHAVFFNGRFEKPIKDQLETPEAQNGLGCVSCHSITNIDSTMGNGGFTIEYPAMHDLATSPNPYLQWAHDFLTKVNPAPHRKVFLKPFMKDSSEFCSTCHKVHLDGPVNNYRWLRGFNEYDNWQGSGVSGQGARSFYYPDKPLTCGGCHMPLVPSKDAGNVKGMVHNHRFAAANTAVAHVNGDEKQLAATKGFLQSGFISVDLFSAAPADTAPQTQMVRRGDNGPQTMTTFAVGEESDHGGAQAFLREVSQVAAPLDRTETKFQPGSTVRLDVVVRTKKIGHFFPGGTVDSFDVWLELEGRDATGQVVFWSGGATEKTAVDKGAHFYRSFQLDGDGNPVNKRNAWQTRSVLYVRLIPPGAADVAHYRVKIPKNAKGPLTFTAKLNYRKFSHYYNEYVYGLQPKAGQDAKLAGIQYDSREYERKPGAKVPEIPITTLAKSTVRLQLAAPGEKTEWKAAAQRGDRERWNDWGIGMLLQGDLKGAEYAFTRVTEAQPDYADGWLNVGRALIQEGEIDRAKLFVEKALKLSPELPRAWFFQAMAQKADGDYDGALASLKRVAEKYPRDRVVQNQMGRVLFLKRDYEQALAAFQRVLEVDPEDVQAHYNLMLVYRGLGKKEESAREQLLFARFKADESSQEGTAKIRALSPEDNNERQMIHEHESAPVHVKAGGDK